MGSFRKSNYRRAWEKFVEVLKRNPELKKIKVWRTWDGSPESASDFSAGQAPWIRLEAKPLPSEYLDNQHHVSPVEVKVESVASESTDIGETMDLCEAIMRSFWTGNETTQAKLDAELRAVGMSPVEMIKPSWGVRNGGKDGGLPLYGEGSFVFEVYPLTKNEHLPEES